VFENREMRNICVSQREKGTGYWGKKMHNEKLKDFYSPLNIIQVIKPRTKGCMGCVANMGEENTGFWCGKR
jgi:hypothetical protein